MSYARCGICRHCGRWMKFMDGLFVCKTVGCGHIETKRMSNITIQATGCMPTVFEGELIAARTESLEEKRGVNLRLYRRSDGMFVGELMYITSWGIERPYTWVFEKDTLEGVAEYVREAAKFIMPPGAGYPATPQYEARQAKLVGMMETITLTALTFVLAEASGART